MNITRIGDRNTAPLDSALRANIVERGDAAGDLSTRYRIGAGDTFSGRIDRAGDMDVVRLDVSGGRYDITLNGRGGAALGDPVLGLFDANGRLIAENDDANGRNSAISINLTAGTYYLAAQGYSTGYTGDYALRVTENTVNLPTYTLTQIAHQLTDEFWEYNGSGRRAFDVAPGGVLNVDISGLTAAGQRLATAALTAWTDVTGIRFATNAAGNAHITFDDNNQGAYSSSEVFGGRIQSSFVNVGLDWLQGNGINFDGYSYQTYIHEIGHALGLGHAGNYNGSANWGEHNHYANDSWQATIMSYFSQDQNTEVDASFAWVVSAMMADVLAMRDLYGAANLRMANTTYGENSNAGGSYGIISNLLGNRNSDDITFTIVDGGGLDTLNLVGDSGNQRINMSQGAISDAYGLRGNISIMQGTLIENLRAGTGNDVLIGNVTNNFIFGNAGNDHLASGFGADTLQGGPGRDTMVGGVGNDFYMTDGLDSIIEGVNAGRDVVQSAVNYHLTANLEELRLVGGARNGLGNNLGNTIVGNQLGNDLRGYGGADRLLGGGGNDTLTGGIGVDVFVFNAGRDRVMDFQNNIDTIQIDNALWGNTPRSVAQLLQSAVVVNGDTVFNFANGHSLTVENLTNISALADDLIII